MTKTVYFIKPVGMDGPIKVGCSQSPTRRRAALATWSPFPLEIIAEIDGGFHLEKTIHEALWHLHERREWFRADPLIDAIVKAANEGNFMVAMLPDNPPPSGGWRNKKAPPPWVAKQVSLSRRVWTAHVHSGYDCPVNHRDVWKDGRESDLPAIEQFIAAPHSNGVPSPYDFMAIRRDDYHARLQPKAA